MGLGLTRKARSSWLSLPLKTAPGRVEGGGLGLKLPFVLCVPSAVSASPCPECAPQFPPRCMPLLTPYPPPRSWRGCSSPKSTHTETHHSWQILSACPPLTSPHPPQLLPPWPFKPPNTSAFRALAPLVRHALAPSVRCALCSHLQHLKQGESTPLPPQFTY